MQATLTYPYNTIQPYSSGGQPQSYNLAVNCGVTSSNVTVTNVVVNAGAPALILLPSTTSGGNNTINITSGPTYQNNQILFTVKATPDPNQIGQTDSVVINLTFAVAYTYSDNSDGLTPTAAVSILEIQNSFTNYLMGLTGSNRDSPNFYGHNVQPAGQTNYPANTNMLLSIALKPPGPEADAGGVGIDVSGNGNATCVTAQATVTVNNQASPVPKGRK
jgi:hypothetical protein